MASTNMGDQLITFRYQQEGTAEGFNKLLCGVLPEGVISGGELTKVSDSTVQIDRMQLLIGDGNVTIHVQTRELIPSVAINNNKPYIVASFNWAQSVNNFVSFEAKSLNDINSMNNPIILGKGVFIGANLSTQFDYSRKTWCPSAKYNDFFYNSYNSRVPSFNITAIENPTNEIGFVVGKGRAIINGKYVEKTSEEKILLTENDTNYHKIVLGINSSNVRIDIAVLMDDGSIRYIMGNQASEAEAKPPIYPSNGLVLAEFKYTTSINYNDGILGYNIKNIYSNNYMAFSPTVGQQKGGNTVNQHTLFL